MTKTETDILQMCIMTGSAVIIKSKAHQEAAYWTLRKAGIITTTKESDIHRVIKIKNHQHHWEEINAE